MTLSLEEILDALAPCWRYANKTTEDGTFVRPDYRRALGEAWTDIVVAAESKRRRETVQERPHSTLNVAMTRRNKHVPCESCDTPVDTDGEQIDGHPPGYWLCPGCAGKSQATKYPPPPPEKRIVTQK